LRQLKKTSSALVLSLFFFFSITIFIQGSVHAAAQGDRSGNQESEELNSSSSDSRINETLAGLNYAGLYLYDMAEKPLFIIENEMRTLWYWTF